mgnify:CR=1 FL=1
MARSTDFGARRAEPAALGEGIAATLPQGAQFVLVRRNALPRNAMGKLERKLVAEQLDRGVSRRSGAA